MATLQWLNFYSFFFLEELNRSSLSETDKGLLFYLDRVFGMSKFKNTQYFTSFTHGNHDSVGKDLTGGSFASLDRQHVVRKAHLV